MTEVFMTPPFREPSPLSIESTLNNKLAAFVAVSFAVIFVSQDLIGIGYQALLSILYTTSAVIDSLQVG